MLASLEVTGESCHFFVKRKKRFCRMSVKAGNKYCGEHLEVLNKSPEGESVTGSEDSKTKRIVCPLDRTHTCYESKLTKHLKVCNAKRLADQQPSYIVQGTNLGETNEDPPKRVPLPQLEPAIVQAVLEKVDRAHARLPPIEEEILCEKIVKIETEKESCGNELRRHLLQNASLLGHVKRSGLAENGACFVEFGAGKGKLTYWLARTIIADFSPDSTILLVDRSSHRHKSDNKLKNQEFPIAITRIRADIADLRLIDVPEMRKTDRVVGIAKHLCGSATDLTIRCLVGLGQAGEKRKETAMIIALCCHHRCEYTSYVGKKYLQDCGFTKEEFPILCSIASWATCSTGKNRKAIVEDEEKNNKLIAERESTGRKVKKLLNWGRIDYLSGLGFSSKLVYYTSPDVSLENVCLIAVPKKT